MNAGETILKIQELLGVPINLRVKRIGPLTRALFERLAVTDASKSWDDVNALVGDDDKIRSISDNGLAFVKEFEGLFLNAYKDGGGVWTIGWGHTGLQHMDGTVYAGRKITKEKAEELLRYDMRQFEERVNRLVTVDLNQDQFDALVSFDFNTGGLEGSTLLRLLNNNNYIGADAEFLKWDHDNGVKVKGLTRRRQSEKNLFEGKRPFIVS